MNTNTKHTPGPWTTPGTDGIDRVICATVKGQRRTIAHAYAPHRDQENAAEIRDANARLIAAAPALLDALRSLVEWEGIMGGFDSTRWDEARQAIAAATEI